MSKSTHRWDLSQNRQLRLFLEDEAGQEQLAAQIQKVSEEGVYKVMVIRSSEDYEVWDGGTELGDAVWSLAGFLGRKDITELAS